MARLILQIISFITNGGYDPTGHTSTDRYNNNANQEIRGWAGPTGKGIIVMAINGHTTVMAILLPHNKGRYYTY